MLKGTKKIKVFVAMSGGVDSSVAAALLKERGFDARGVHIKMWGDPEIPCNFKNDRHDAMRVAAVLDIPFETWDFTKEYKKEVVDYMIREFKVGRTPNPDVMCNKHIKFGIFLKKALAKGADFVATGHYVRLRRKGSGSTSSPHKYVLSQSKDNDKDQSYFLWTLKQDQLKHCLFPIGEYTKPEVRKMAKKFKLPTAEKKDSQGICFIGEIDLREFLQKYIKSKPGKIFTTGGKEVGKHIGLQFYTIGQRHGIEIGGGIPYYVAKKDFKRNRLIVAVGPYDEKLFERKIKIGKIHWISGTAPKLPLKCEARIRYRQPLQECVIKKEARSKKQELGKDSLILNSKFLILFRVPQRAVTPGQSIVFYQDKEMLGGAVIR